MPTDLSVAMFNIHAGIDGWGRPFDVLASVRRIDADVLIVAEDVRRIGDQNSMAQEVGERLGYSVVDVPFVEVEITDGFGPSPDEPRWGPPGLRPPIRAIRYRDEAMLPWRRPTAPERAQRSRPATLGLALLSRLPYRASVIALPNLVADPSRRSLVLLDIALRDGTIRVAGTHLGHLTHGSPFQMRAIRNALRAGPPTVLGGDMNCWGPLLLRYLPAMRRGVIGPTWPSWRPRHQIDHLLHSAGTAVADPAVFDSLGSDHRAIRATFGLHEISRAAR